MAAYPPSGDGRNFVGQPWTWVQQGWQCPVCKTVWAPHFPNCTCSKVTVTIGATTDSTEEAPAEAQESEKADP